MKDENVIDTSNMSSDQVDLVYEEIANSLNEFAINGFKYSLPFASLIGLVFGYFSEQKYGFENVIFPSIFVTVITILIYLSVLQKIMPLLGRYRLTKKLMEKGATITTIKT